MAEFDVVVVGSGPAGYHAGIRLAQNGLSVAVVERADVGGTCTNRGCIPMKALIYGAEVIHTLDKAKRIGISCAGREVDIGKLLKHMQTNIMMSRKGVETILTKRNVEIIRGEAKFHGRELIIGDKQIHYRYLILATGSHPILFPPFNQVEGVWTSDDLFKMERLPESIIIVGGGVIGIETATFMSALGVSVQIVELMPQILPTEDEDVADVVEKSLRRRGVKIYKSAKTTSVEKTSAGYVLKAETPDGEIALEAEQVMLSVGRAPNIPAGAEEVVKLYRKGIETDENLLAADKIYAVGDVRGKIMLAHWAAHEGIRAAHHILGRPIPKSPYVPAAIFSIPEIGSVGKKEKDLEKGTYIVGKAPLSANGRARTILEREGFIKVIAEKNTGKLLGITVVGSGASEIVATGSVALQAGMDIHQLAETIFAHPTIAEFIKEAAEVAIGNAIHII